MFIVIILSSYYRETNGVCNISMSLIKESNAGVSNSGARIKTIKNKCKLKEEE